MTKFNYGQTHPLDTGRKEMPANVTGGAVPVEATRLGSYQKQLYAKIDQLHDRFNTLVDILEPILTSPIPEPAEVKGTGPANCALFHELESSMDYIDVLQAKIDNAIDRVAIK